MWWTLLIAAAVVVFSTVAVLLAVALLRWMERHEDVLGEFAVDTFYALPWIALYIGLFFALAGLAGAIGMFFWPVTVVVGLMVFSRCREAERRALAAMLAVAAEKGISLDAAARAFAQDCRGKIARRARRLGDMLRRGVALPVALVNSGIRLPTDAHVAFAIGCQWGGLNSAVDDATSAAVQVDPIARDVAGKIAYLAAIVLYAAGVVTFLMYRIVPQYVKIFWDFEIELPAPTLLAIWVSDKVADNPLLAGVGYLVLGALLCVVMGHYIGAVRWEPPLVRRLWRRLDQAVVLRALAQAVDQQRPLPVAIAALARLYPKRHVRRRLFAAAARAVGGGDWCAALEAAGLLRPDESGVLKAAQRAGNLKWALREMADRSVRTFAARASAILSVVFPVLLLVIGGAIFVVSAGIFLPLVKITQSML